MIEFILLAGFILIVLVLFSRGLGNIVLFFINMFNEATKRKRD